MTYLGPPTSEGSARSDRYGPRPPRVRAPGQDSAEYWLESARKVVLDMLDVHHAVTASEMEARASDRTWKTSLCPYPINPHWFVNARNQLLGEGLIEVTDAPSRGHPDPIRTWHLPPLRGRLRLIENTSARKRLLTARHAGWSGRGGAGRGLRVRVSIGRAV